MIFLDTSQIFENGKKSHSRWFKPSKRLYRIVELRKIIQQNCIDFIKSKKHRYRTKIID